MAFEYIKLMYGVPAEIGRLVKVYDEPGIIVEDRGLYLGVNFNKDKPGIVKNCHPTCNVEYGEIGIIRKQTKSQSRYQRYLKVSECFNSFIDFCRWDSKQSK